MRIFNDSALESEHKASRLLIGTYSKGGLDVAEHVRAPDLECQSEAVDTTGEPDVDVAWLSESKWGVVYDLHWVVSWQRIHDRVVLCNGGAICVGACCSRL